MFNSTRLKCFWSRYLNLKIQFFEEFLKELNHLPNNNSPNILFFINTSKFNGFIFNLQPLDNKCFHLASSSKSRLLQLYFRLGSILFFSLELLN